MKAALQFLTVICLFILAQSTFAQFVELEVKLDTVFWRPGSSADSTHTNRCVIGTNEWMIEDTTPYQRDRFLFNGLNLRQEHTLIAYPSKYPDMFKRNHPEFEAKIGQPSVSLLPFEDRTPLHTVRVAEAPWTLPGKIMWLAYASGSFLKQDHRDLFPPSEFWKAMMHLPTGGFADDTKLFEDALSLPSRIDLHTTNRQPVFQYAVSQSTNFLGWEVPLRFHMTQYRPAGSNAWQVYFSARGEVISIREGKKPRFATDAN